MKEFTYLGSILTANNDISNEVQRRINTANRSYYSLLPIVKNKIISREIKTKIYKTLTFSKHSLHLDIQYVS